MIPETVKVASWEVSGLPGKEALIITDWGFQIDRIIKTTTDLLNWGSKKNEKTFLMDIGVFTESIKL